LQEGRVDSLMETISALFNEVCSNNSWPERAV
jgi:hypothetical protein